MITKIDKFNQDQLKKNSPNINPGDTIKVHQKIKEGEKERTQIFEGLVIAKKHGKGISSNITVRRVISGVGVERIFPVNSPSIDKIEVIRRSKVKRAKLYYLRTAKGKRSKLKEDFIQAVATPAVKETIEAPADTTAENTEKK